MTARKRRGGGGSPDKDVDGDVDMDKSKEQGGGGRGGARRRARRQCGSAGVPGAAASRAGGGAVRLALLSAACVASAALLWPALAPLLPLGLVGLGGAGDGGAPRCRAWIDTHRFKANETRLVAEALAAAGCTPAHDLSRRHTKRSPEGSDWMARPGVSGADWEHRPRWDVLWTPTRTCLPTHAARNRRCVDKFRSAATLRLHLVCREGRRSAWALERSVALERWWNRL